MAIIMRAIRHLTFRTRWICVVGLCTFVAAGAETIGGQGQPMLNDKLLQGDLRRLNKHGKAVQPKTELGFQYLVQKGDTITTVVDAYNRALGKKSMKTSKALVEGANPSVKSGELVSGTRIFVPVVEEKPRGK